jgi:toxin ParE1/3/4
VAKYILSPAAQIRLKEIKAYSLENFGKRQTTIYLKNLHKCMQDLANEPSKGTERNDIKKGYYSKFIVSHTIYYRISDKDIGIIDILHQSMEPKRHIL